MKMASIFCGAVIVLSLVAGQAQAQIDSNSIVSVYSGNVTGSCVMTVNVLLHGSVTSTYDDERSITAGYEGSHRYSGPNTYPWGPGFDVDTNAKMIKGFNIIKRYDYTDQYNAHGEDNLMISFGSLPYSDSFGIIQVNGMFDASYSFSTILGGGQTYYESGNCASSGDAQDSVRITIAPSKLGVAAVGNPVIRRFSVSVVNDDVGFVFPVSNRIRELRILDVAGRVRKEQTISSDSQEIKISLSQLPPGCYFARLGDQVAKFVVLPR